MKLIYKSDEDHDNLMFLLKDWLRRRKFEELTAMGCRQLFNKSYGLDIDHHDFSYALEEMVSSGEAIRENGKYSIK